MSADMASDCGAIRTCSWPRAQFGVFISSEISYVIRHVKRNILAESPAGLCPAFARIRAPDSEETWEPVRATDRGATLRSTWAGHRRPGW